MSGNPGELDRKIVLQKRTVSKDGTGSRVETWVDNASVWAEKVVQKGREAVLADAERSQDSQQFRIRYRAALVDPNAASDFRIYYKSRFYNITGVTEEGRQDRLLLDTVATQAVAV